LTIKTINNQENISTKIIDFLLTLIFSKIVQFFNIVTNPSTNLAHETRKGLSDPSTRRITAQEHPTPVGSKVPRLKSRTFSGLTFSRRYDGVAGTIDRSLFIGSNSSPFRKNICLGIERFCTAGNDGAQRRAILRERANRRHPTIPTS